MLEVECPCGATFEVEEEEIDGELRCPQCRETLTGCSPDEEDEHVGEPEQLDTWPETTSLLNEIGPALRYPLQVQGYYVLVLGWIMGASFLFVCRYSPFGFVGAAIVFSYFATFLDSVILEAAGGGNRFPDWPDAGEFVSNILEPYWRLLVVAIASGGPFLATWIVLMLGAVPIHGDPTITALLWSLGLLWIFVLPVAYLSGLLLGPFWAFNYAHIVRAIASTLGNYIFCFLVVLFLAGVFVAYEILATWLPLVGPILSSLVAMYLWVVFSRLLGVYYRASRRSLRWLRSDSP